MIRKLLFNIRLPFGRLKVIASFRSLNCINCLKLKQKSLILPDQFLCVRACGSTIQFICEKCSTNWKCLQRMKKRSAGIFFFSYLFYLLAERDSRVMAEKWLLRHRLTCPQPVAAGDRCKLIALTFIQPEHSYGCIRQLE